MVVKKVKCENLSDNEIIQRSMDDLEYFACLFDRYESVLLQYIKRISSVSQEDAEDILQDAFIKIWRNLFEFDYSLKLSNWLYRIVHNETVSYGRKKRSFGKNNTVAFDENLVDELHSDLFLETNSEHKYLMTQKILNELPVKYKECIVLKYFEHMSYDEISDILKIPEGTVAIRINRAKKMFKKIAEKENISFHP